MTRDNTNLPAPSVLLTSNQAEEYLGLSKGKLRQARHHGYLFEGVPCPPFIPMGRRVFYRRDELNAWINNMPSFTSSAEAYMALEAAND